MQLKFLSLKGQINQLSNIIVVYGEDDYLRDRAVEQIKSALDVEFPELNVSVMSNAAMDDVINSAIVLPFMSGTRFVVVKNYTAPDGHEQRERDKFLNYAKNALNSTVLVFSVNKLSSVLSDVATVDYVECNKLDRNAIEKWISAYCRKCGKTISPYNARLISEYCLDDMTRINSEVQKICFYSDGEVTKNDIDLMIEKDSDIKLYEFANEIANKNADKAFQLANGLLSKGTKITTLVSSVYNTFRRMFFSVVSGMGQNEMASYLGVKPFAVTKAREVAEKFTQIKLKRALEICAQADENLKKNINNNAVVNFLILSLINL